MKKLTIIIPAHNEEATISDLLGSLSAIKEVDEILVVDDGSTDRTAAVAQKGGARVISHRYRRGNGAAVKTGLQNAASEWVIIMDADGQHETEDLLRLVQEPADYLLVVGARPFRWFRLRDFGNIFLGAFATLMSGDRISDLTSGFRRIHRPTAMSFWYLYPEGYSFPSTSTMLFASAGFPISFISIKNRPRPAHASASKLQPFRQGLRFVTIIYRIALLGYPMRFFAPLGSLLIFAGIGWTIHTIRHTRQVSAGGALLFLSGLTLLLFGTLADQMSHIRKVLAKKTDS
jgi:glycosyltransferase involved in cell wall biosynthesis